jgi:hypothetical protein
VRGALLLAAAAVGATPAALTMLAVRTAAHRVGADDRSHEFGRNLADLHDLRRLLQRLLTALGAIVVLAIMALGTSRLAITSLPPADRPASVLPAEGVLAFGVSTSVVVGLLYVPAVAALRSVAAGVAEHIADLRSATTAAEAAERAERRRQLEQSMDVDKSVLADLQAAVIVLAPLLTSAVALLLPR